MRSLITAKHGSVRQRYCWCKQFAEERRVAESRSRVHIATLGRQTVLASRARDRVASADVIAKQRHIQMQVLDI